MSAEQQQIPEKIKVTTKDATKYLYLMAKIKGIEPVQRYRILHTLYGIILTGLSTFYLPFAFTYGYFSYPDENINISAFLTTFQVAFNVYGGSIKFIAVIFMWNRLRTCELVMTKLDERCKHDEEFLELRRLQVLGRRICMSIFLTYITYSTSTFVSGLFRGRPPYSIYLPYIDWRRSKAEFFLASFIEYCSMDLLSIQQTISDGYPLVYLTIIRAHVRILIMRLNRLDNEKHLNPAQHMDNLILCIKDHKLILEMCQILDPILSLTIFTQFAITALILGITLMHITIFTRDLATRIANFSYILAVLAQFFPVCYFAQSLCDTSDLLPNHIFHTKWMYKSKDYRKLLIYFIQRTQIPMNFSAGKLFPISLYSFVNIAKFSFSIYTFITKMNLDTRLGNKHDQ